MLYLPVTRASLPLNLALEEALLEAAEAAVGESEDERTSMSGDAETGAIHEYLRLWESPEYAVIVGRSSSVEREVRVDRCKSESIPILRRCSGGASVVIGPGCLMYAVMLDLRKRPMLRALDRVHRFVMERIRQACLTLGVPAVFQGTCDLTIDNRKFSGNSLRCKRHHTLYHGTLLYDFDLARIPQLLKEPARQPDYREKRLHDLFVINLASQASGITRGALMQSLQKTWEAHEEIELPMDLQEELLARDRYASEQWTYKIP